MLTVRQELQAAKIDALDTGGLQAYLPPDLRRNLTNRVMDQAECLIWRKFDQLKRDGKLKILRFIDASGIVEKALRLILGERPVGCE